MDRAWALDQLPEVYALAIRLSEAGASREVIAAGCQCEPDSVELMLRLAHTKLSTLLRLGDTTGADDGEDDGRRGPPHGNAGPDGA